MIKILPYYERSEKEKANILSLYFNMVADVVPFMSEDVLYGVKVASDSKSTTPRLRSSSYAGLLAEFKIIPQFGHLDKREQDALLARRLINNYSVELHEYLYEGKGLADYHINREHLRELLTIQMPLGALSDKMDFRLPEDRVQRPHEKKKRKKTEEEKKKEAELKRRKDLLFNEVFRYEVFKSHANAYQFLQLLNVTVCPYCNRQYITTVSNEKKRTRPQLDHFKNKNAYPFLALSINNLVPSCSICNLLKHDDDKNLIYPYEEGMGELFVFETKDRKGAFTKLRTGALLATEEFDVELNCKVKDTDSLELREAAIRAKNSIEELALKDLYQSHKAYVLNLYFQRYIHTDDLCEDIIRQFPILARRNRAPDDNTPLTDEEVSAAKENLKMALFLMDYSYEKWGDRPLAKLTHDIAKEIDRRSATTAENILRK